MQQTKLQNREDFMRPLDPCEAYRPREGLCRNGFPQSPLCRGDIQTRIVPACEKDEVPKHLSDVHGRMIYRSTDKR